MALLTILPLEGLQLRAAQQNGILVRLDDITARTRLTDTFRKRIPLVLIKDATVIVRALEGDVSTDCVVNVVDQQMVASRFGVTVGSLQYRSALDLEPVLPIDGDIDINDLQNVFGRSGSSCDAPNPDQPGPPAQPTPTPKPTPTPTPTPPLRNVKVPQLQNLFLTNQGPKLAPATCEASNNVAVFTHELTTHPSTTNIKGDLQFVASFEFEVRFDPKLVCVNIEPGQHAVNNLMTCFIDDKDQGLIPDGLARIGCATAKATINTDSTQLAVIRVQPQPELYHQISPNQQNGIVAQILNQDCNLGDSQGHPINNTRCDDSDLTIRWLEGDVNGDCVVNVTDQQELAFRWGAGFGKLLFDPRMDLEPSGAISGDGDIDIKDVQFVFGRQGSTCGPQNRYGHTGPENPPQDPVGKKGPPVPSGLPR